MLYGKLFYMFTRKILSPFEEGKCTQNKISLMNIKLGTKLIVDDNQVAYIVVKGKPYDKFSTGEFELEGGVLPKVYKVCNLNKPRKGRVTKKIYYPKHFRASIIFINLQKYKNLPFKTGNILLFDRLDDFKFKINGIYDFEIVDINTFSKFVAKYGHGNDYIMKKLNNYVSKKVRYEFHKEEFEIEHFIMKDSNIFDKIMDKLNKRLLKIGILFSNPIITDFITNKRNTNKINKYISEGHIRLHYQKYLQGENNVITQ